MVIFIRIVAERNRFVSIQEHVFQFKVVTVLAELRTDTVAAFVAVFKVLESVTLFKGAGHLESRVEISRTQVE